jgi:hypothetical protein
LKRSALTLEKLKAVLTGRLAMRPIAVVDTRVQAPAHYSRILELQWNNDGSYRFVAAHPGVRDVPRAHGKFVFVILRDDPGRIYCGSVNGFGESGPAARFLVEGHTSISGGADILYAGELNFKMGSLVSWSNESGHYQPSAELRNVNIIPWLRRMLPEHKFRPLVFEAPSDDWSF